MSFFNWSNNNDFSKEKQEIIQKLKEKNTFKLAKLKAGKLSTWQSLQYQYLVFRTKTKKTGNIVLVFLLIALTGAVILNQDSIGHFIEKTNIASDENEVKYYALLFAIVLDSLAVFFKLKGMKLWSYVISLVVLFVVLLSGINELEPIKDTKPELTLTYFFEAINAIWRSTLGMVSFLAAVGLSGYIRKIIDSSYSKDFEDLDILTRFKIRRRLFYSRIVSFFNSERLRKLVPRPNFNDTCLAFKIRKPSFKKYLKRIGYFNSNYVSALPPEKKKKVKAEKVKAGV